MPAQHASKPRLSTTRLGFQNHFLPTAVGLFVVLMALAGGTMAASGQTPVPSAIVVTFAEAPALEDCVQAIHTVGGSRIIAEHDGGALDRLPIIMASGEASGTTPECWLYSGAALDVRLNQPATTVAFNRSGTVWVQVYRNNALIHETESSGLGGRYTYQQGGGFNRIIIREAGEGSTSYVALDDLQLEVPDLTASHLTRFEAMGVDTCTDQLDLPDWVTAEGGVLVNGACAIAAGDTLTISVTRPFQYWDALIDGDLTLILHTTRAAEPPQALLTDGAIFVGERDPADYVRLQLVGGAGGATVDDLRLTWVLSDPRVDGAVVGCVEGACHLSAGESVTLNMPAPMWAVALTVSGDVLVQGWRDGSLVDVWRGVGSGGVRVVTFWAGIDVLVIREASQRDGATVQMGGLYALSPPHAAP